MPAPIGAVPYALRNTGAMPKSIRIKISDDDFERWRNYATHTVIRELARQDAGDD